MDEKDSTAVDKFWKMFDNARQRAGDPKAPAVSRIAADVVGQRVAERTIRDWFRHERLPREADVNDDETPDILVVISVLQYLERKQSGRSVTKADAILAPTTKSAWVTALNDARDMGKTPQQEKSEPISVDAEPMPKPSKTRRRKRLIASAVAALVVVLGIGAWLFIPEANADGPQPATGVSNARCLQVKNETKDVSVFKDAVGDDKWTEWPGKTRFWADGATTHPNRWRVPLDNGEYGYVGKNAKYIVTANDCR